MTSFAFILGVVPMLIASGAGAQSRHSLATGVFSGMLFLGERPGASEFVALVLVLASLFAVLWQPAQKKEPAIATEPEP